MVGICFKHDPGYQDLLRDQYYELVKAFPGLTIYEREVPEGELLSYNGCPLTNITNADELPVEPTLVIITGQDAEYIKGDVNLKDYVHPESAIYFVGDDHSDLTQEKIGITTNYDKVYIPINENIWSSQALGMVLYDRQLKNS